MDSQTNIHQGRDQFILNQPESVKLDVSSPGPRPVSVTGLDPIAPRIDRWIDRTQDQAALLTRIEADPPFPLLEVVGAGGFGKTWLVAWVYYQLENTVDRALWVNFRKVPSFNQFGRWVLQEIGCPMEMQLGERISNKDLANELIFRLRDQRRVLLVMDQLEAILASRDRDPFSRFLQRWQRDGRKSTVLVATQQSLLPEELQKELQEEPQGETPTHYRLDLAGLSAAEGETLLRHQHQLTQAIDNGLSRLVEIASGHPLLLNLAANWLQQNARTDAKTAVDETPYAFSSSSFAATQATQKPRSRKSLPSCSTPFPTPYKRYYWASASTAIPSIWQQPRPCYQQSPPPTWTA